MHSASGNARHRKHHLVHQKKRSDGSSRVPEVLWILWNQSDPECKHRVMRASLARRVRVDWLLVPALALALPLTVRAQSAFEVASIRPSEPRTAATYKYTPTGLFYTGATLGDCILAAYQISGFELS